jgi:hypothetical protein
LGPPRTLRDFSISHVQLGSKRSRN